MGVIGPHHFAAGFDRFIFDEALERMDPSANTIAGLNHGDFVTGTLELVRGTHSPESRPHYDDTLPRRASRREPQRIAEEQTRPGRKRGSQHFAARQTIGWGAESSIEELEEVKRHIRVRVSIERSLTQRRAKPQRL